MHIEFERTGGVAGLRLAYSLDSETLPDIDRAELKRLVDASGFFDLSEGGPQAASPPAAGPDAFQYVIAIQDGNRSNRVEAGDAAAPDGLKPLIGWLTKAARAGRGPAG